MSLLPHQERSKPVETEKSQKYNQLKLAYNEAAEAHTKARSHYLKSQEEPENKESWLTAAAKQTIEAVRLTNKAIELELELTGSIEGNKSGDYETLTNGINDTFVTQDIFDMQLELVEKHEAIFRHYAILEHEEDAHHHRNVAQTIQSEALSHVDAAEQHERDIETLKRMDEIPLIDRPEFDRFAAAVANCDWTGTSPENRYIHHVEPELQVATIDFAREAGLEIPDVNDDSREEERSAIFSLVDAAFAAHIYQITNPPT